MKSPNPPTMRDGLEEIVESSDVTGFLIHALAFAFVGVMGYVAGVNFVVNLLS